MPEPDPSADLDLRIRLAADRILRAVTLRRQAKVVILASAALSIVAAVRPDVLPPDLVVLKELLNVGAINTLLKDVAGGAKLTDEEIAARMEGALPLDRLDELLVGQNDLLRALTRQHARLQEMLQLQADDAQASARLQDGFDALTQLIEARLLPLLNVQTPPPVPVQLPPAATHFTGRAPELAALLAALQPGRVVTLYGPGGIGKTALAAEALRALLAEQNPPPTPPEGRGAGLPLPLGEGWGEGLPPRFPGGVLFHTFYGLSLIHI